MSAYVTAPGRATVKRMIAAFHAAAARHGARPGQATAQSWGWRGRTLSGPAHRDDGTVWIRLAASPADAVIETFWYGNLTAEQHLESSLPRPRLLAFQEFTDDGWAYASEVFEHTQAMALSRRPALEQQPGHLGDTWWNDLKSTLAAVAPVSTTRVTVYPRFATRVVSKMFGPTAPTIPDVDQWITSHGDLHWANLAGPDLTVFDWEGWGRAPAGYDAATLLCHSLLCPEAADQVRARFADQLDTPAGQAGLALVLAEQLWQRQDYPNDPHVQAMQQLAAECGWNTNVNSISVMPTLGRPATKNQGDRQE